MREFSPDRKLLERAEALTEIDRWEEAIPLLNRYLIQEPDSHRANCFLSACFYHLKNTKEALKYAEYGIHCNPQDEWGHRLHSLALTQSLLHKQALVSAKEAVRLAPEEPLAIQRLMNAYLNCNMTKEALEEGEKLRALQPEKDDVYVTMGYILMEKKRYREAIELFHEALKINPVCSTALNNLGVIYLRQKQEERAFEYFLKAIQADPTDKLALDNLKLTVKYDSLWFRIIICVLFPPALIGFLIYMASNYQKIQRFHKLPPSVQTFLKPSKPASSAFAEFLDSPGILKATRIVFFIILIFLLIFIINILINGIKDVDAFFLRTLILPGLTLLLGLFWFYLVKRNRTLR